MAPIRLNEVSTRELKLTAGGSAVTEDCSLEIGEDLNPLTHAPAECESLTVDEHFAPCVGKCLERPVKLQHLAIQCSRLPASTSDASTCDTSTSDTDPLKVLCDLSHLTQLTSLKLEAPAEHDDVLAYILTKCPESLTNVYIGGWRYDQVSFVWSMVFLPTCALEHENLRRLTKLELRECRVVMPHGCTTCLEGLTSLSMTRSHIDGQLDQVMRLTNLVSLDLTDIHPHGLIAHPNAQKPWSKFDTWPALRVLKFAGCCMIDNSTALDISAVTEVHTDMLTQGMETANIHLVVRHTHANMFRFLSTLASPVWCTCIVALHVAATDVQHTAFCLATVTNQVLETLACLQSFHFEGQQCHKHGQARFILGNGYSGQLKDLTLQHMCFRIIDLESATCLTSISLKGVDCCTFCELKLPAVWYNLSFLAIV